MKNAQFWWTLTAAIILVILFMTLLYTSGFRTLHPTTDPARDTFLIDQSNIHRQQTNQSSVLELDTYY